MAGGQNLLAVGRESSLLKPLIPALKSRYETAIFAVPYPRRLVLAERDDISPIGREFGVLQVAGMPL